MWLFRGTLVTLGGLFDRGALGFVALGLNGLGI